MSVYPRNFGNDSRNPAGEAGEEIVTAAPDAGVPAPAAPAPAAAAANCSVKSAPAYTPGGMVPVNKTGGRQSAPFSFGASFNPAVATNAKPSCCQARQFIKWDSVFHAWNGGPPHSGFPNSTAAGTWIEDRDSGDKRYGHRADSFSDPIAGCGDEYTTAGTRDQANGDVYCGKDAPGGPATMKGQFQFRLDVVDTCNGDAVKSSSPMITVNWQPTAPSPPPSRP